MTEHSNENTLCGTIIVDRCHYIIDLSNTIEYTTPTVNHNVQYGLSLIVSISVGPSFVPNVPMSYGILIKRLGCVREGSIWKISIPFTQFCSDPKTAIKMKASLS